MASSDRDNNGDSLRWHDYLEVVLLVLACLLGLLGNMAVFRVSLRIRTFSRQISLLFGGILLADVLVCSTRIPITVFLILSTASSNHYNHRPTSGSAVTLTSPMTLTSDLDNTVFTGRRSMVVSEGRNSVETLDVGDGSESGGDHTRYHSEEIGDGGKDVDIACEIWAATSAIMVTIVLLHLAVSSQRLAIIFSFARYRKVFTHTLTALMVLGAWCVGLVLVYIPLRVVGLPLERAGRGACQPRQTTSGDVLLARTVALGLLCLLPLLITMGCYVVVMRSVWLAREVRTESAAEYNRVVLVTLFRLLGLLLTFVPLCLLLMLEVKPGTLPEAAHRYGGHLLWLQSALSPYITMQDNDFRDKVMVPNKHAQDLQRNGGVQQGGGGDGQVMPDIGSSGGQDGDEHRARNLQEMNREIRRSQLQRGISFITSADLRTIKSSTE